MLILIYLTEHFAAFQHNDIHQIALFASASSYATLLFSTEVMPLKIRVSLLAGRKEEINKKSVAAQTSKTIPQTRSAQVWDSLLEPT